MTKIINEMEEKKEFIKKKNNIYKRCTIVSNIH